MGGFLFAVARRCAFFVTCGIAASVGLSFALPRVFDFIEFRFDTTLSYEAVVRLTLLAVYAVLLIGGLWWVLSRGQHKHLLVWGVLALSFIAFAVVVFGDRSHRLMEEFSWIRYTTCFFLLLASTAAFLLRRGILSWLLGIGFLYAALDEVLEIHEKLGRALGALVPLPPNITDYITIVYAVIGFVAVLGIVRYARRWVNESPYSIGILLMAAGTYMLSTLFDSADFWVLARLRALSSFWASHVGSYFIDVMYTLWAPRNFLNGLEELLEQLAATLFFVAPMSALLAQRSRVWMDKPITIRHTKWFVVTCVPFFVAVAVIAWFGGRPPVPVIPGAGETIIAGAPQGLFHTDDVAYHPAWGVVVANEGRGNVYQWYNNEWRQIPDPSHLIKDSDSVAVDDTRIYVADSAQGIIFAYSNLLDPGSRQGVPDGPSKRRPRTVRDDRKNDTGGWKPLFTRADGLIQPEGLAVVDKTLYVLDESEKTITKLTQGKAVELWRPDHPRWVAPESIAYDSTRSKLYVSDDVSGALFVVDFEKRAISEVTTLPRPEDITVLPDGTLLATDTRAGAIFRVYPDDGRTEKIAQFKRSYRDLQGIAYDGEQVYMVSADGFGSSSFMPSFLWALPWVNG